MKKMPIFKSMLKSRLIVLISLLIVSFANAQDIILKGSVNDIETLKSISEANISVKNTNFGTYSNEKGEFTLSICCLPIKIKVSHIGFESQEIEILSSSQICRILLKKEVIPLKSVDISANRIRNLVEDKKLYIIDYAVNNDSLLLLCYNERHINEGQMVLMNSESRILYRKNIKHINRFEEDFKQQNYLIGKNSARAIAVQNQLIELKEEWALDEFNKVQNTIIAYSSPFYYLRQNIADNQIIKLYRFNEKTQNLELFKTIADEAGLERLGDKARLQSAVNYTAADARFEEMCFYAPKFIPMIYMDEQFFLFNFEENKIEIIDTIGEIIKTIPIVFHQEKHWKKQLLIDRITGALYAVFEKNGFYNISQIDLETGRLKENIAIPHFVYIEKIKINNGKLYFLYKGNIDNKYKELYSMKI